MHTAIPYEDELLHKLLVLKVTYSHPYLIRVGNPSGHFMFADVEELQGLVDKLEGESCTTN